MAKKMRAKEKTNYRFFFAVAMLALVAVGLSFYTNPDVSSSFQGLSFAAPTAAAVFKEANGYGFEMTGGISGSNTFAANGGNKYDTINLKFTKTQACRYTTNEPYEQGTGFFGTDTLIEVTDSKNAKVYSGTWPATFNPKGDITSGFDMKLFLSPSWKDGEYTLTVRCPTLDEASKAYNARYSQPQAASYNYGPEMQPITAKFKISHAAYAAETFYTAKSLCGAGKRCAANEQCIDATFGLCIPEPLTPTVTPCNKGDWLQYDGSALHQGCTADVVYDASNAIIPILKWSYALAGGDANGHNPPVIKGDTVYSTNGNCMEAVSKGTGEKKWSSCLDSGAFTGSPAATKITTVRKSTYATVSEGVQTSDLSGAISVQTKQEKNVFYGGVAHDAIISATTDGKLVAFDAATGAKVCDKAVNDGKEIENAQSCWDPLSVGQITGSPAVFDGNIYIATAYGVAKINGEGLVMWFYPAQGATMPTVSGEGKIYFATKDGTVHALSQANDATQALFKFKDDGKIEKPKYDKVTIDCRASAAEELVNSVKLCAWKSDSGKAINMRCVFGESSQGQENKHYFDTVLGTCTETTPEQFKSAVVGSLTAPLTYIAGPFVGSSKDTLIASTTDGKILRLNADDLKQFGAGTKNVWQWPAPQTSPQPSPFTDNNKPAVSVIVPPAVTGAATQYGFNLLVYYAGQLRYLGENSGYVWDAATQKPVSPMTISVTSPVAAAYFVDSDGWLNVFEASNGGISLQGGELRPDKGSGKPIRIYKTGTATSKPILSGDMLYVQAGRKLYAFIVDSEAPTVKAKPLESAYAYSDENVKLCADLTDNMGLTQATLVVKPQSGEATTYTKAVSGKGAKACFDYSSDVKGVYDWYFQATDVGKNGAYTGRSTFTVVERPKVDTERPTATVATANDVFLNANSDNMVDPQEALEFTTNLDDDVQIKSWGAWVCTSDLKDGCIPKNRIIGPASATDAWSNPLMPTDLFDSFAYWETVEAGPGMAHGLPSEQPNFHVTPKSTSFKALDGGWPQGKYVFWTVHVCDEASKYPPRDSTGKATSQQSDKCGLMAVNSFYVPDKTPPEVVNAAASDSKLVPDGKASITLSAYASDKVALDSVTFTVDGKVIDYPLTQLADRKATLKWSIDLTGQPDKQGRAIKWSVTAKDKSGLTTTTEGQSFKVNDIRNPEIKASAAAYSNVREGDSISVYVSAADNSQLDTIQLYVDNKACTGEGAAQTNKRLAYVTLTCPAPSMTTSKKDVNWYVTATDAATNSVTGATGSIHLLPSCGTKSTNAPVISGMTEANATLLPGDTTLLTAKLTDDVDAATLCGGIDNAWLEVQGEDGVWRWAGDADLKVTKKQFSTDEGRDKVSAADVEFNLSIPKRDENAIVFSTAKLTTANLGILGRGGIAGGGLSGAIGITGHAVTTGQAARPYGTPGTQIKWRIVSTDTLAHQNAPTGRAIGIIDNELPALVSARQPSNTLVYDSKAELEACFKDNGQVSKITFETDETGATVKHELDVAGDNAWQYAAVCRKYTLDATGMSPGKAVHWSAYADDLSKNSLASPQQTVAIISKPPVITGEKAEPASPVQGAPVTITVSATDDYGLASAKLESNETGVFKEIGSRDVSGKTADIQFTWNNPVVPAGTLVYWRMKVTDLDGSTVITDPAFVVQPDKTAPTVTNSAESAPSIVQGGTVTLKADLGDNGALSLAILETDEDGTLRNMTTKPVNGQAASVSFDWQNKNVLAGKTVKWRIYASDVAGNSAAGPQLSFTVTEAAKTCPTCPPATQFGKCSNSLQTRTIYTCDASTNYLCQAKSDSQSCTVSPADTAFDAINAARDAIATASGKGNDVSEATTKLDEAELAYANKDYAAAQAAAIAAKNLAESSGGTAVNPTYIIGAGLLVIAASIVAVFAKKKDLLKPKAKIEKPAMPEK